MGSLDAATWQALGLLLTLVGLVVSALLWVRRGPVSGLRGIAWSLLPLAAGLTGVLRLGWEIADSVVSWAARLAFSPVVWLGLAVGLVSLVLFAVSGFLRRRQAAPETKPGAPAVQDPGRKRLPPSAAQDDDLADVEAILRKHGIT